MEYMSVAEAAQKWGLTPRNVQIHCEKGNIPGVTMQGKSWQIPVDAGRPMRKPRAKGMPHSILEALKSEKRGRISGGLYHRLQIDITYNSNHIEGSRLTHEQTRWIFETQTIGNVGADVPVDDIVETANHFRAVDIIIESAGAALTEQYIKKLHAQLKGGTSDSRKAWFKVGEYKKLDNVV
ncbi:MAG: cell filamentation protein Fic, partial [Kiritimatiellae bacterium]|nr:cell filamentation protein Fic [Kiritimatiellia bacterium]